MSKQQKRRPRRLFNVFDETVPYDKARIHKVVRGASRRIDIACQFTDGHSEYDDIPDTDPFDMNAPVIVVQDDDFAYWARDISDAPEKYDGKVMRIKFEMVPRFTWTTEKRASDDTS